jgi:hypothetical protein
VRDRHGTCRLAHHGDRVRWRPEELDARVLAGLRQVLVLAEEAVAGMQRVAAGLLGGGDDLPDVEVALARLAAAEMDRVGGAANVQGRAVGIGVDRDGLDAHLLGGADHAQRDLATVGNEDASEQCHVGAEG